MRICIDLDGVICQLRKKNELYQDLKPIDGSIEKITKLKNNGHYIILYTARRMKTHNANTAKVIADIGKITLDWLEKYNIPYDEIMFGKPWANIYIDDNAFRFSNWDIIKEDGTNLPISNEDKIRGDE
jgi:capsule biosynthesis phosphatase